MLGLAVFLTHSALLYLLQSVLLCYQYNQCCYVVLATTVIAGIVLLLLLFPHTVLVLFLSLIVLGVFLPYSCSDFCSDRWPSFFFLFYACPCSSSCDASYRSYESLFILARILNTALIITILAMLMIIVLVLAFILIRFLSLVLLLACV